MRDMDQNDDLFERCLKGGLSTAERAAFEDRLRSDRAFAEDLATFRAAYDAAMVAGEVELRKKLNAIHDAQEPGSGERGRVVKLFPARWLTLAASVVLALVTTYLLLKPANNTEDLFAEHMVAYGGPDRLRSDRVNDNDPWTRFTDLYHAGRYDEALRELNAPPMSPVPDYLRMFYRGQCLLLQERPDPQAAMTVFEQVLGTDNDLHAATHWYFALAALKADDPALARAHLDTLVKADGYKRDESRELLEALP